MKRRHHIGRLAVAVNTNSTTDHQGLQLEINTYCKEHLLPLLEKVFDGFSDDPDEVIHIQQLELDLDVISADKWKTQLKKELRHQLQLKLMKLRIHQPSQNYRVQSLPRSHFEQWLYFLESGQLQNRDAPGERELRLQHVLDSIASDGLAYRAFRALIKNSSQALRRLCLQHEPAFLVQLLNACSGTDHRELPLQLQELSEYLEITPVVKSLENRLGSFIWARETRPERLWQLYIAKALDQDRIKNYTLPVFIQELIRYWEPKPSHAGEILGDIIQGLRSQAADKFGLLQIARPQLEASYHNKTVVTRRPVSVLKNAKSPSLQKQLEQYSKEDNSESNGLLTVDRNKELPALVQMRMSEDEPSIHTQNRRFTSQHNEGAQQVEGALKPKEPQERLLTVLGKTGNLFLYLDYAGIILLHPYLQTLFENLELMENGQFTNTEAQERATHLLHYMATGKEQCEEHEMSIAKFLCGFAVESPIRKQVRLSTEERQEANVLLQTVIEYWTALGKATTESLRETFFRREGKLEQSPKGWTLKVEQKTLDVLLERMPWGLSIVKLPWLNHLVFVEWI